ncbi:MAG: low-specificity L-threonine aldolase [Acidimicrobiaceae bacterium]|nr:low-specificity L-threonine aldolase [Acidimicrobiaceae bacterium]
MIDLRSDTVTRPTPAMRAAMAAAEVGDDVHGEDTTANELQDTVAALLGKEAALFVTSGTQGNLCGLLAHCGRGDEYIVGGHAHTYMYEGGGAAVLGSIQPQPVPTGDDGMIDLAAAEAAVKSPDHHFARTRLLCLENTTDGRVLTLGQMEASAALAARHGLAHHLDGARLWNASVALGVSPAAVAEPFDSVSVCLSKGLGTPMGSVLVGPADLIDEAHKWRKMLGGGLRQAGIVAAAGLYALEHHIDRLADDHANAARLADGLAAIDGVKIDWCATNMVFIRDDEGLGDSSDLQDVLEGRGILTRWSGSRSRLVTHLDVTAEDIETAIDAFAELLA